MAKWANFSVLEQGPNLVKISCTKMLLISTYHFGDSYATVVANKLAEVSMVSSDFVFSTIGNNRILTAASKNTTATATSSVNPDLHIAYTNGVDTVYWVTDEISNMQVILGNGVTFPTIVWVSQQPV